MTNRTLAVSALLAAIIFLGRDHVSNHAESAPPDRNRTLELTVAKAINYLRSQGQANDGSYSAHAGPGITALITTAILRNGRSANDPAVAVSLQYLEKFVQKDGGIYQPGTLYRNYETCLSIVCFQVANEDGQYDAIIQKADKFIKELQWDQDEGKDPGDPAYGGAGYGKHRRPDLSNSTFFVEALRAAGNAADSEALQRALLFVSRCQNLETEFNTTAPAAKINDGGFYYTAAEGGKSQSGVTDNGGLRSYGSMTYAGLKSMIYAGVGPEDFRMKAAIGWIQRHYDLESNPGLGDSGLYYYYHTFAKALSLLGEHTFVDAEGTEHDWRSELIHELAGKQREDGSWINGNARWLEGDQNLVTGYALLALSYCRK